MSIAIGKCVLGQKPSVALAVRDDCGREDIAPSLEHGIDMLEFRIDQFQNTDTEAIATHLQAFADIPAIGTIRSQKEGGDFSQDEEARGACYKNIMPHINAIDIEIGADDINSDVIKAAKQLEKVVIGSFHNFDCTPPRTSLEEILHKGKSLDADIIKVAAYCNKPDDFRTLAQFLVNNENENLIVIGMGAAGAPSRILFPFLGSLITYTFLGKPSAPGQFGCEETITLLKKFSQEN